MVDTTRQMHFGISLGDTGVHPAAWRLARPRGTTPNIQDFVYMAKAAEAAKFDMIFTADGMELDVTIENLKYQQPWRELEPITMLSALAMVTENVGLVSTASTTFSEPYPLARTFASLDHISGGRAGWNIVTSLGGAKNFGLSEMPSEAAKYERAHEMLEVVKALWNSWDADAKIEDAETGIYADPSKVHEIDYVGKIFSVKGPLNISRSPQGRPVLIQAGSSATGKAFGGKYADVIFTAQSDLPTAQAFYREMNQIAIDSGRPAESIRIMPGLSPVVAATHAEAVDKFEHLVSLIAPSIIMQRVSGALHADLADLDLDDTVPEHLIPELGSVATHPSRFAMYREWAVGQKKTIRQMGREATSSDGHLLVVGSGEEVADNLIHRFSNFGADGFNIVPASLPQTLDDFAEHVIPILQDRGLFRTEYEGSMLRENLGLGELS
ncbi:LLM class flavin-dependent oxidoreductase [Glaciihabitans sp. dw_435]|uniref:LLM class flavin-dependent oxidoreductase n=1 Tax=Glaciihabitans sp. dw_435 TaxID=2720081 RepID=UPI001BD1BEB3|nr:LLM class flavin-dependent oxidoreductase [Glaciihabitans sp. dw_435]